jgi:hypothetical protein
MKSIILNVVKETPLDMRQVDAVISFRKYLNYLKERAEQETTVRKTFFEMVIRKFEENPDFLNPIPLHELNKYDEELSHVYGMLIPPVLDEKDILWAISSPITPIIFYGTDIFYKLMTEENSNQLKCDLVSESNFSLKHKVLTIYSLILEKFYDFPIPHQSDMLISLRDESTGLKKYYKIAIDNRFTDVIAKGPLPELDRDATRRHLQESADLTELMELLPLSLFRFEGISVLTLEDVTEDHAIENLKSTILNRNSFDSQTYYNHITDSLKMLVENHDIQFGLMPMLKVNNKLIFNKSTILHSKLINAAIEGDMAEETYASIAEEYFKNPRIFFMRSFGEEDEKRDLIRVLKADGVESYALLPVYYDNRVAGVLEVYSSKTQAIDEKVLAKIDPALPFIAQIFENTIDEFNADIENVIREKFTSLQPAVQWKFKDVAWHYLRDRAVKSHGAVIESIGFKDVYPLYGAIDIRNSTLERNTALREDLRLQFNMLIDTFCLLKEKLGFGLADEMVFKCKKMLAQITDESVDNDEIKVHEFLETEVHPFLLHFKENRVTKGTSVLVAAGSNEADSEVDEIPAAIERYFEITDEHTGAAFANRRALEASMQTINSSVNLYLDLFKNEIQESYPTYFEKFRTDGIEYDIYIGQSIEPQKTFSNLYLKNIRLWQLTSMAAIAKITNSLLPGMEKKLLTTQLIFINSGSIDISFRDDERRFDVEGAYNIRYQVIKKRIDKVHVKATGERLTQPGKIAMVYFNNKSAEEYSDYIRYLQEQNTLLNDLEYLDLEELQGVSGLRALRVGVNLETAWK